MKLTEAQKKANRKWDKENMVTLACHVRKEQAEKFKDFTVQKGKSVNQMLKEYVLEQIKESDE